MLKKILMLLAIILALMIKIFLIGSNYGGDNNAVQNVLNSALKPTQIPPEVIELDKTKEELVNANKDIEHLQIQLTSRNAEINRAKVIKECTIQVINSNIGGRLANKGQIIYEASIKYGLNPVLQTSIMMHETGYGRDKASSLYSHNNVGGVFSGSKLKHYKTVDDAIYDMAKVLRTYYINAGRQTIKTIGAKYCPVGAKNDPTGLNKHWVPSVQKHYNKLTEGIEYAITNNKSN